MLYLSAQIVQFAYRPAPIGLRAAAESGQYSELYHQQNIQVDRLIVPHQPCRAPPAGLITFNQQNHVAFMREPRRILQNDQQFAGVKVNHQLMRTPRAQDSNVTQHRFAASQDLFPCDFVPLLASCGYRIPMCFQTHVASRSAASRLSLFSWLCVSADSLAARYSSAALLAFSSAIEPFTQEIK